MPDAIIHDFAVKDALLELVNVLATIQVDLFTNNLTPDRSDDTPAFTFAAFPGYARYEWPILPITISPPHVGKGTPGVAVFDAPSSGSPVDIYGFLVSYQDRATGNRHALMSARFSDAPRSFAVGDPPMTFNLFLTDEDATL